MDLAKQTKTMPISILDQVTLGYQLVWNQSRQHCAVQLFVGAHPTESIDVAHLLTTIGSFWSAQAPSLLLSPQSPQLLTKLLDQAPADAARIEVNQAWLLDPAITQRVHHARRRCALSGRQGWRDGRNGGAGQQQAHRERGGDS